MPRRTAKIIGFMALATILGVVRAEVTNANAKASTTSKIGHALADPFLVMAGGTLGTAILLTLSDVGGSAIGDFAVGLAGLTLLAAAIYSGPTAFGVIKNATTPKTSPAPKSATPAPKGAPA